MLALVTLSIALPGCAAPTLGGVGAAGAADTAEASPRLQINEFLASNVSGEADGTGDAEDWVEIYNPGSVAISLDGWWITDDLDEPQKVALDASLSVPAGGWLLLWADGEPEEGPDHLALKLDASGEALGLYDPGGATVDALSFPAQTDDVAAARFPDGGGWSLTAAPTPGSSNGEAP